MVAPQWRSASRNCDECCSRQGGCLANVMESSLSQVLGLGSEPLSQHWFWPRGLEWRAAARESGTEAGRCGAGGSGDTGCDRRQRAGAGFFSRRRSSMKERVVVSAALALMLSAFPVLAVSPNIVISQVYGGGGNTGAPYTHDFIELFNRGAAAASLSGMTLQYASATGTGNFGASSTQLTDLPAVTLQPGQYYLVQEAGGARRRRTADSGHHGRDADCHERHSREGRARQQYGDSGLQRWFDTVQWSAARLDHRSGRIRDCELFRGRRGSRTRPIRPRCFEPPAAAPTRTITAPTSAPRRLVLAIPPRPSRRARGPSS